MAKQNREQNIRGEQDRTHLKDNPDQAVESGEPTETGRTHGELLDATDQGQPGESPDTEQDLESGRHDSNV